MTNHTARIGGALVGGYLLGRTRKARMALGLGMFLAGRKLSLSPPQLGRMAANSPALSGLSDQARKELVDATKSAATSALTKRAEGLADTLHQRTLDLRGTPGEADGDAEEPGDTDAEPVDPETDADAREGTARSTDGEGGSAKRSAPRRRAPAEKTSSGRTGSGKTGSGKSGSGKSGSGKTSRTASTKRTSGGAGTARSATKSATKNATKNVKAASGGRRSSDRGGDDG